MNGLERVRFSYHAHERMRDMDVQEGEVLLALVEPELEYPSPARYGPGKRVYCRDRVAVVLHERSLRIVTVLWDTRGKVNWTREDPAPDYRRFR